MHGRINEPPPPMLGAVSRVRLTGEWSEVLATKVLQKADVLLVQGEDPWQDPTGGIVAFTKCLLRAFGNRVAVASPCDESLPVGVWSARSFEGRDMAFFNLGSLGLKRGKKPLIPAKIHVCRRVRQHIRTLYATGPRNLMLDSPEVLFPAKHFSWDSVCFWFHGLGNPVACSRYRWARPFGGLYERQLLRSLHTIDPEAVIVAADQRAIEVFRIGGGRSLDPHRLHSFPTRVDTDVFFPEPRKAAQADLQLRPSQLTLVANGRLNWIKGWPLLLDALDIVRRHVPSVHLIFVGDGEDRGKIANQVARMRLEDHVSITGFVPQPMVRQYLNAADVCVVASHSEGWSLAMLEVLACGKPLVSTDVSGTGAMIREGRNGFIARHRDPEQFATAVLRAAELPRASAVSLDIVERYSMKNLAADLGRLWKPLAGGSHAALSNPPVTRAVA